MPKIKDREDYQNNICIKKKKREEKEKENFVKNSVGSERTFFIEHKCAIIAPLFVYMTIGRAIFTIEANRAERDRRPMWT